MKHKKLLPNKDYIIKLYENKKSLKEISKLYKTSPFRITDFLKDSGIRIRTRMENGKRNDLDYSFFEKIDQENKAYILGLLFADGNVYKYNETKGRISLILQKRDEKILYQIGNILFSPSTNLIKHYKKPDGKEYSGLMIHSIKLCNDLINNGCVPNKTHILEFPFTVILPQNLQSHFIRGYFDGDGCITIDKRWDTLHFSLSGTYNFLKELQAILMLECGLKANKIILRKGKRTYQLGYAAKSDLLKIRDFLYSNATIFLERKKFKFFRTPVNQIMCA